MAEELEDITNQVIDDPVEEIDSSRILPSVQVKAHTRKPRGTKTPGPLDKGYVPPPPETIPTSTFKGTLPGPMTGTPAGFTGEQGPRVSGGPSLEKIMEGQAARKRATVPTKAQLARMTPEEKLRLADERAALGIGPTASVRASTPEEIARGKEIEAEQEAYEKFGPTLYGIREGINRGIKALGDQFTAPFKEPITRPATLQEMLQAKARGEEPQLQVYTGEDAPKLEAYQQIVRSGNESPLAQAIPKVLEYGVPLVVQDLLLRGMGGGTPLTEAGPPPEMTAPGAPLKLGPGEAIPPTPPAPPALPQQLGRGRTIVGFPPVKPPVRPQYLPPGPGDLARLSPGRLAPLGDIGLASAVPPRLGGTAQDMNFSLIPSESPGQAPSMLTPGWVTETAAGKPVDGVNVLLGDVPSLKNSLITTAPSKAHLSEALFQIEKLVAASKAQGLGSISLINREAPIEQVVPHETFHAGQAELAPTVFDVHDPQWAKDHPIIQELVQNNPNLKSQIASAGNQRDVEDILAAELPTYVAAGQGDYYFDNPTVGTDFLYDYFNHISDRHGVGALDILSTTAKLPPESREILESARSTYESRKRERQLSTITAQPGTEIQGGGPQGSLVSGVSGYEAGGALSRGDQEGVGDIGQQVPGALSTAVEPIRGVTPAERESNRLKFLEGSQYQQPMFHGTTADFDVFQKTGDIGFHFGTKDAAQDRISVKHDLEWTEAGKPVYINPILTPDASIGSYWISAKNPLYVKDIFLSGDLEGTVKNMLNNNYITRNTRLMFLLDAIAQGWRSPEERAIIHTNLKEEVIKQLEARGYDSLEYTNRVEDPGSTSVVVFRPTQIKSVTGNIGTYDPTRSSVSVSVPPKEGDIVKVKGYGANAEVTKILPDGGVEVKFPDGTLDEFDSDQVKQVSPVATIPPKTPAQQALAENPVVTLPEDPQMMLPGMEGTKSPSMVAPPGMPPQPPQPPLPGIGGPEYPLMTVRRLTEEATNAANVAFGKLLESGGAKLDPSKNVFMQVLRAMDKGQIGSPDFAKWLEENDLTEDTYKEMYAGTVSAAGRTLQQLSRDKQIALNIAKGNPKLGTLLFSPRDLFEELIKDIHNGALGNSMWYRSGGILRSMMLQDLASAMRVALVSTMRIPLWAVDHGGGAWLEAMAAGKDAGLTLGKRIGEANRAAVASMKPAMEVLSALNPTELDKLVRGVDGSKQQYYNEVLDQLSETFPDLKKRLLFTYAKSRITPIEQAEMTDQLSFAKQLIGQMKDVNIREQSLKELKVYEDRFNSNINGLGKVVGTGEYLLSWLPSPLRMSEFLFKRSMFVGHLKASLIKKGLDLDNLLAEENGTDKIPDDVMEQSLNEALDYTWQKMPPKDGAWYEQAGYHFIKQMNALGPIGGLVQGFPKVLYNAMNFTYEHSPLGAAPGLYKMLNPQYAKDPVTGKDVRVNNLTSDDYLRLSKAFFGTALFAAATFAIHEGLTGSEWWQLKTGRKDKNNNPIYVDIRPYPIFSHIMHFADIIDRAVTGRMGDLSLTKELTEAFTGVQTYGEDNDVLGAVLKMWDDDTTKQDKALRGVGMSLALATKPLINLRRLVEMFSDEENKKRDIAGHEILGPTMMNIPWLSRMLPEKTSPTQEGPINETESPLAAFSGVKLVAGEGFAGREWRRMGLSTSKFLKPDPDPIINAAQNKYFQKALAPIEKSMQNSPYYNRVNDDEKIALWREQIKGEDGIEEEAKAAGLAANPIEAQRRENERQSLKETGRKPPVQHPEVGFGAIRTMPGVPRW